jgi:predicted phosphodiesterase
MTKQNFDLILTAHLHHFNADEKNEIVIVSNGSLMGTDQYAKDLRLSSIPSQNLILVTDKSVVDYIHRVILN